ncbi:MULTISPECIES: helix-turn-helix transcriptional regulator [unclassified Sporolactobacillus]|uniref:helix-turn-helix transcriptional regulator n=1 Tax=unclassified Sporolactobacillus TaxID=2628533 RepID=UPI002368B26D|nr:metalloregulator ArsR/SmtB family transcription factor [Sporolactobacillus sp. CQH2019]MDD9150100.1 transcriptional regulator [Sporolactobacillus sp. CQH2019]
MKGTKDKILDILKREQPLSAGDLAKLLHMTEMGVRKHLSALEGGGLIQAENLKRPVGRPVQLFSLTEKAETSFPKNYEHIAVQFLKDIEQLYGEKAVRQLFEKRKGRLYQAYRPAISREKSDEGKAEALARLQNEHGYMCRLHRIGDGTFELIEYNCPILAVAKQYKLACRFETSLMKSVLGAESADRMLCRADGEAHCRFRIRFSGGKR